ncbi:MAG: DUF937 domain-containing protein [Cyanothece sp. SIO1E1]|nr:DUF937 domain-containing protein [Cyanothece sp. SIO1E1]
MNLLQGQLSEGVLDQLTQQIGASDSKQTAAATAGIMNTLVGALAKNASNPEGAQSLSNALDRDHDGSVLDNVMDMFTGGGQVAQQNNRAMNGAGILNHILGDRQGGAIDMISKISGLDSGKTGNLMTMLAPMLMGALGRQKRQQGLDVGGLANLLTGTVTQQNQSPQNPTMSLVTKFLDADGDGSITDDVANIGMKLLGGLFGRKKR